MSIIFFCNKILFGISNQIIMMQLDFKIFYKEDKKFLILMLSKKNFLLSFSYFVSFASLKKFHFILK